MILIVFFFGRSGVCLTRLFCFLGSAIARAVGGIGIVVSCRCFGSGCIESWCIANCGEWSRKRDAKEAPLVMICLFFVGEAETHWDFGSYMDFSTLLRTALFSFFVIISLFSSSSSSLNLFKDEDRRGCISYILTSSHFCCSWWGSSCLSSCSYSCCSLCWISCFRWVFYVDADPFLFFLTQAGG